MAAYGLSASYGCYICTESLCLCFGPSMPPPWPLFAPTLAPPWPHPVPMLPPPWPSLNLCCKVLPATVLQSPPPLPPHAPFLKQGVSVAGHSNPGAADGPMGNSQPSSTPAVDHSPGPGGTPLHCRGHPCFCPQGTINSTTDQRPMCCTSLYLPFTFILCIYPLILCICPLVLCI